MGGYFTGVVRAPLTALCCGAIITPTLLEGAEGKGYAAEAAQAVWKRQGPNATGRRYGTAAIDVYCARLAGEHIKTGAALGARLRRRRRRPAAGAAPVSLRFRQIYHRYYP